MARITSVMAGIACALAMCLAFPVAAAPPDEHQIFDVIGHELAVAPVEFEMAAAGGVFDLAMPMIAAAESAGDGRVNCSDSPAWVSVMTPSGLYTVERLPGCTTDRHRDPGWRAS